MTSTNPRPLVAICAVAFVVLVGAVTLTALASSEVDEVRTVRPGVEVARVDVEIDAGRIRIIPADELSITVEQHADRFAARPFASTEVADDLLRVTGSCTPLGIGQCHTPVTIATPPGIAIHTHTEAGSIKGEIVSGTLEAATSAGSINLAVTGEVTRLKATTSAGQIELVVPDEVYAVDARTSLGATRVEVDTADDAHRTIQARSEVGRVTIQTHKDAL